MFKRLLLILLVTSLGQTLVAGAMANRSLAARERLIAKSAAVPVEAKPFPQDWDPAMDAMMMIGWDAHKHSLVISLSPAPKMSKKTPVLKLHGSPQGSGNQAQACIHLVLESMFCGAIAQCKNLESKEYNVYAIKFVDARQALDSMPRRPEPRKCRPGTVDLPWKAIRAEFSTAERQMAAGGVLSAVGKAVLGYFGVVGPGVALGKQCPLDLGRSDVLVGHMRSGDIMDPDSHILKAARRERGQPPLKYWITAMHLPEFSSAVLMAQDLENPVAATLDALKDTEVGRGRYTLNHSMPLTDVLFHLLCARSVVMGVTTMDVMVGPSWNLQKLILPGSTCPTAKAKFFDTSKIWILGTGDKVPWDSSLKMKLSLLTNGNVSDSIQPCHNLSRGRR